MLQKMKRIQVVGPRKDMERAVDLLYREGTLHLENAAGTIPKNEIRLRPATTALAQEINEILTKIRNIFITLPAGPADTSRTGRLRSSFRSMQPEEVLARARELIAELETTTRNLASKKTELTLTITSMTRYAEVLSIIQPVERELPMLEDFEVTVLLIRKEYAEVLDLIKSELNAITGNRFEMISATVDPETLAAILVFPKSYSQEIHSFIFSVNVNEVRLPREYMGRPIYEMYALIEEAKIKAGDEIKEIDAWLGKLSSSWYEELSVLLAILEDMSGEQAAFSQFAVSDYTFVIRGWIPKKVLGPTRTAIDTVFQGRVVIDELPVTGKDLESAPTFYDNPRWVRPFEFLMKLVSPPGHNEIDPSPILAIFFPIFFGIMVGDIGYGLIILAVGLIVKRIYNNLDWVKSVADILIISSIPTIFFGYLFGEFFGDFGEMMGWLHPVHFLGVTWNRIEAMIPLLLFAIALGVIHVFLGLIIGIVNSVTLKSTKHVCEKCGMILILTALIILMGIFAELLPPEAIYATAAFAVIALPLIIYGAGVFGTIEIMSTVGNILSYARLMAIGMASVILAMVANRLGGAFDILIVGGIVAVLLHIMNIVLAMFSPSIHSVRLHLVEFFSKFYKGEGVEYRPFKKKEGEEQVTG